jgi:hypothetical protein
VQRDLEDAIDFHTAIIAEGNNALIGYGTAKALANVVLLSEMPTTCDKREQRQVNALPSGNSSPTAEGGRCGPEDVRRRESAGR